MKYTDTEITFREFPDEISLCINISNCPFKCPGCHSPELWEDIGTELTRIEVGRLIETNKGITCVGFMGGKPDIVNTLAAFIKNNYPEIKVGFYWGGNDVSIDLKNFDYIKLGPYLEEFGGLDNPNTNQRMYKVDHPANKMQDITYKFWKHGE